MSAIPASRVEVFDVPVPAGTAKASPIEVATGFDPGELSRVEIVFPDGCNGLVGIQLALAHGQVVPYTRGAWLVGNDDELAYNLVGVPNSGAWSVFAYNSDVYAHIVHVRYSVTDFNYLGAGVAGSTRVTPPLS